MIDVSLTALNRLLNLDIVSDKVGYSARDLVSVANLDS